MTTALDHSIGRHNARSRFKSPCPTRNTIVGIWSPLGGTKLSLGSTLWGWSASSLITGGGGAAEERSYWIATNSRPDFARSHDDEKLLTEPQRQRI